MRKPTKKAKVVRTRAHLSDHHHLFVFFGYFFSQVATSLNRHPSSLPKITRFCAQLNWILFLPLYAQLADTKHQLVQLGLVIIESESERPGHSHARAHRHRHAWGVCLGEISQKKKSKTAAQSNGQEKMK